MNPINKIVCEPFGVCDGREIFKFKLTNVHGNYVELLNYGAIVKSIVVPDKNGKKENVVLGFPTLKGYINDNCYIGATIGRFSNRINNAEFSIGNKIYHLDKNDGKNNNHSGSAGFNSKVFDFLVIDDDVIFTLDSKDGEGGFPGNLKTEVIYNWTNRNELKIKYLAISDEKTLLNFTNHSYFNLSGCRDKIQNHHLTIRSNSILESTPDYIPTGEIVAADKLSFSNKKLGEVMQNKGLNVFYIFDKDKTQPDFVCELSEEESGRKMRVQTSYPGVQLYTGDYLNSKIMGEHSKLYKPFDGVCLECQYYPDSPNHEHFSNTIFGSGEFYNETITYSFDVMNLKYATDDED
ncbi:MULTISPECIES: aldose epimerase family protein [unclassified Flavobacterium]|jgi:aldose 1-epimerase|uniref:aldose epimerase family protein n=1 Tax=unclassified Flavobacterium TaxID=196869 RepID=UPI0012A976DF|nr:MULTISPECIES: aldose epimerase family protein [unclassified Flavobacterium]MBF4485432.1 galactose mutarotase [Flavobacterium sp. CSZ]QGK74494.1 galactose-1-epimerase [Flavobacterium sp. SLB02]